MGYSLNAVQAEAVLQALKQNYSVYAPKRFPKQGRYRHPGDAAGNGAARRQTGAGYSQNCRRSPHV